MSSLVGFHSNSFPSEWGQPHLKPLPCLRSRGTFRRSPILTKKIRKISLEKSLKPLQGKRPTLTTKESAFQPFGLSVGCHWSFVIGHSSLVICPLYSSYLGKLGHSVLFPISPSPPLRVTPSPRPRVSPSPPLPLSASPHPRVPASPHLPLSASPKR